MLPVQVHTQILALNVSAVERSNMIVQKSFLVSICLISFFAIVLIHFDGCIIVDWRSMNNISIDLALVDSV